MIGLVLCLLGRHAWRFVNYVAGCHVERCTSCDQLRVR